MKDYGCFAGGKELSLEERLVFYSEMNLIDFDLQTAAVS